MGNSGFQVFGLEGEVMHNRWACPCGSAYGEGRGWSRDNIALCRAGARASAGRPDGRPTLTRI